MGSHLSFSEQQQGLFKPKLSQLWLCLVPCSPLLFRTSSNPKHLEHLAYPCQQGSPVPGSLFFASCRLGFVEEQLGVCCARGISPSPPPDGPRCQGRRARAPRGDLPALPLQLLPLLLAAGLEYSWQQKISTVCAWHWRQIKFLEVPVALFSSHSKSSLPLPLSTCLLRRPADSLLYKWPLLGERGEQLD